MWSNVRLELAQTPEFPRGSASRAYLLRVPLDRKGRINERELRKAPGDATVRRYWPSERDVVGFLVPEQGGWALSFDGSGTDRSPDAFHLAATALALGEKVTITQPDGRCLPFRVARISELVPV